MWNTLGRQVQLGQVYIANLNEPVAIQSGEATEAVHNWQAPARMKALTQVALFTVPSNGALLQCRNIKVVELMIPHPNTVKWLSGSSAVFRGST